MTEFIKVLREAENEFFQKFTEYFVIMSALKKHSL